MLHHVPITVVAMRASIERCEIPEPVAPIFRGLRPAKSEGPFPTVVTDVEEDIDNEAGTVAVIAGPQE